MVQRSLQVSGYLADPSAYLNVCFGISWIMCTWFCTRRYSDQWEYWGNETSFNSRYQEVNSFWIMNPVQDLIRFLQAFMLIKVSILLLTTASNADKKVTSLKADLVPRPNSQYGELGKFNVTSTQKYVYHRFLLSFRAKILGFISLSE